MLRTKNTRISAIGLGGVAIFGWLLAGNAPAQAATFGTDTRAFVRFHDAGTRHGGYLDDSAEYDLTPNGEAFSSISGTDTGLFNSGGASPFTSAWSSSYFASADLRTGELKAFAQNPAIMAPGSNTIYTDITRSNASLFETLTLNLDPSLAAPGAFVMIGFRTTIDGTYSGPAHSQPSGSADITLSASVKRNGNAYYAYSGRQMHHFNAAGSSISAVGSGLTHFGGDTYGFDLGVPFFDATDVVTIDLFNLLSVNAYGSTVDFSHTAALGLVLPQGVTYGSASGVFLQGPVGGVPEPATWAMLITGFGLIGATMRRRTSRAVGAG